MHYRKIGKTGIKVSNISFGASSLGEGFHLLKEEVGIQAVYTAVDNGINFIDVSPYYGHLKAEIVLGKALKTLNEIVIICRQRLAAMEKMALTPGTIQPGEPKRVFLKAWNG